MSPITNARTPDLFVADIEAVKQIATIPSMLEVICRMTGLRFAAVARVTEDRWIACSVRDDIAFGLLPGGELKIETTICNKIRASHKPVIIDNVATDKIYADHPIPKMYGFNSYISFPIVLKTGEFFGTLCAIDPKPAELNNPKVIGLFTLFSELLSFQLQEIDLLDESRSALRKSARFLSRLQHEKRQSHDQPSQALQELADKIGLYSDQMSISADMKDVKRVMELAGKMHFFTGEILDLIRNFADHAAMSKEEIVFERVDLDKILIDVCSQLRPVFVDKRATLLTEKLPVITAAPLQMSYLFFHIIGGTLDFSNNDNPARVRIGCRDTLPKETTHPLLSRQMPDYFEIFIEAEGIVIENSVLDCVFDVFAPKHPDDDHQGFSGKLLNCRKIVHGHGGIIAARSIAREGTSFSIILPVDGRNHRTTPSGMGF